MTCLIYRVQRLLVLPVLAGTERWLDLCRDLRLG
jgi:hypothetical protein